MRLSLQKTKAPNSPRCQKGGKVLSFEATKGKRLNVALEGIVSNEVFVLVENLVALRDVLVQVLEHEECGFLLSFLED